MVLKHCFRMIGVIKNVSQKSSYQKIMNSLLMPNILILIKFYNKKDIKRLMEKLDLTKYLFTNQFMINTLNSMNKDKCF